MKTKITFIVLVAVLILSMGLNIKHLINSAHEEKVFLNNAVHYIGIIDSGLKTLQNYYSTSNYDNFNSEMNLIIKNTYLLDELLNNGSNFVDAGLNYPGISYGFKHIGYAFEGNLNSNKYQGAFTEDGIISNKEIKFINQLSSDLEVILSVMESKDGQNIKSNRTIENFKNLLNTFIKKWDVSAERSTLGFSPYNYLLLKN